VPSTEMEPRRPPNAAADSGLPEPVAEVVQAVKPRLRGWLHAGTAPIALAAGIVLVSLAPTELGRLGGAVFLAASVLLFGTSGIYHRRTWGQPWAGILRRLDHANIYVFIAASYTPLGLLLLSGRSRVTLLSTIWAAALGGMIFRLCWLSAPRWLYTSLYLLMGWAAVGWLGAFLAAGGPTIFAFILAGGACYTAGAAVYARRRPNPWPAWFGFHEIFHACTIAGFGCHYAAISLATYGAG
jgi:hemolysin III